MIYNYPIRKKKSTGETWVINAGNDGSTDYTLSKTTINFKSNNEEFSSIQFIAGIFGSIKYGDTQVGNIDMVSTGVAFTFTNAAYRTVTFLEQPTGDLLTWLQANAVKQ